MTPPGAVWLGPEADSPSIPGGDPTDCPALVGWSWQTMALWPGTRGLAKV